MLQREIKWSLSGLFSLIGIFALITSCNNPATDNQLTVFAAAGAKPAIDEICTSFTQQYGVNVEVNYGGGGEVLSRMVMAKSGDIYIAPEQGFMNSAIEKQAVNSATVKSLAYMVPVIVVTKGNPKNITCLSDLAKPGIRVAVTRAETTLLGKFAPEIFEKAGLSKTIGENVVTMASDPTNLLAMLTMGSIDTGITWHFFGTSASDSIDIIWLPQEQLTGIGQMQAAISTYSNNTGTAQKFLTFLISSAGKDTFRKYGYFTDIEEANKSWK